MLVDLTTIVSKDSPLIAWAKEQDNQHVAMGHIGTHLDTYEKSNIPLEYFESNGVLFDVRGINDVKVSDIDLNKISNGDFVLFRTGQIENFEYGDKGYFDNHPELSNELLEKLIERSVRFIGVDSPGVRRHAEHEEADRLLEKNGIYVIENLKNLSLISNGEFKVFTMWLDDLDLTGLKCRVIAKLA